MRARTTLLLVKVIAVITPLALIILFLRVLRILGRR